MDSRVVTGAAVAFAALALGFVLLHPPAGPRTPVRPPVAASLLRARLHAVRPARVKSRSPRPRRTGAPKTPPAPEKKIEPAVQEKLLEEALDPDADAAERALALDALEAQALEEEQVLRLALLVASPTLNDTVRDAALAALLAVAEDGTTTETRAAALAVVLAYGDMTVESRLAALLDDEDPKMRTRVATALGTVDPEGEATALAALEQALPAERDERVQDAIVGAIVHASHDRALPTLQRLALGATGTAAEILARYEEELARAEPMDPPPAPPPPPDPFGPAPPAPPPPSPDVAPPPPIAPGSSVVPRTETPPGE